MESIYTQCSIAARRLADGEEPFDESAVVLEAANGNGEWQEADFVEADRHAPQVLAALYRTGRLVRFGPVDPEDAPLTGEADYVRRSGHILYAPLDTWEGKKLTTPNGSFDAILYRHDPVFKNGRRRASDRDDFIDWASQVPTPDEPRADVAALKREVNKLREALAAEIAKNDRLATENERLRSRAASERSVKA